MEGTRAIRGGAAPCGGGPPTDGLDIPTRGVGGGGTLANWLNILTHSRQTRRSSVGFTDSIVTGIEDEDLSFEHPHQQQMQQQTQMAMIRKPSEADLLRSRNVSFSEVMTPGGDGDLYFVNQFRRRVSVNTASGGGEGTGLTLEAASTSIQLTKDGMLRLEEVEVAKDRPAVVENSSQLTHARSFPTMESISEGLLMGQAEPAVAALTTTTTRLGQPPSAEKISDDDDSVFLIDFEAVQDGDRLKLKPQSRKFGISTLFDTHLAQNWFFRKNGHEQEEEDEEDHQQPNHHHHQPEGAPHIFTADADDGQHGHWDFGESRHSAADERGGGALGVGLLGRIQQAVADHPIRLREMNAWEPQGT